MGRLSREKGKTFERKIATILRKRWPESSVRRASQADRAYESDVVIESGRGSEIWWECNHARNPQLMDKLKQAERDCWDFYYRNRKYRTPVVVWQKHGTRAINVTLRLEALIEITGVNNVTSDAPVTLAFADFLDLIAPASKVEK